MTHWGLVLSGGAAYGLANAGILNILEREKFSPSCIAGSSMGAIVASLYAYTGGTDAFRPLCDSLRMSQVACLSSAPLKGGLHGGILRQRLDDLLGSILGDACIGDCRIPFVCVAAKVTEAIDWKRVMRHGFTEYVLKRTSLHVFPPETRLIDAVMASSAIPVLFSPVTIGSDTFVDLVHFGAIPSRTLKERFSPDVLIATDTNPRYKRLEKFLPPSWREFLERGYQELERSKLACDLVIAPTMPAPLYRFDRARAFMEAGEKAAEKALPEIKKLL